MLTHDHARRQFISISMYHFWVAGNFHPPSLCTECWLSAVAMLTKILYHTNQLNVSLKLNRDKPHIKVTLFCSDVIIVTRREGPTLPPPARKANDRKHVSKFINWNYRFTCDDPGFKSHLKTFLLNNYFNAAYNCILFPAPLKLCKQCYVNWNYLFTSISTIICLKLILIIICYP